MTERDTSPGSAPADRPGSPLVSVVVGERITALDAVRGVAVLGILTMNVVIYGLGTAGTAAYFNLDAGGSSTRLDWVIGFTGEVFFDQKFMGLFSLLFGAGIVLFTERAEARGRRAGQLSLWRNFLLLLIGLAHTTLWDGDVLVVYAACAPLVIMLRRRRPGALLATGALLVLSSAAVGAAAQTTIDDPLLELGDGYWFNDGAMSDVVGVWFLWDFFSRALGMMLIGVALYRLDVLSGRRDRVLYRRFAWVGLGSGLPVAALGAARVAADGFSADVAIAGAAPNTIATIPMVMGYLGLIVLWNSADGESGLRRRVRAAGRMALTNYITQTLIGIAVLRGVLNADDLTRSHLALFVAAVWALQLWWSQAWLSRFRQGPAEWLWRLATYRRWQPLHPDSPVGSSVESCAGSSVESSVETAHGQEEVEGCGPVGSSVESCVGSSVGTDPE